MEPSETKLVFYSCVECGHEWDYSKNINDLSFNDSCPECDSNKIEIQFDFFED